MAAEVVNLALRYVTATQEALLPLSDPERAVPMTAYMKDVAPFLGIGTEDRRQALKAAWRALPQLSEADLADVSDELWALDEREYQYAACDLIAREQRHLSTTFLSTTVEHLITAKPWWDTVDSLGSAAVSPLTMRDPQTLALMWQWLDSGDRWLIRAAIQHQRGRKDATDFDVLYAMCDRFAEEREFFIAKAIGWALRDATRWDWIGVQEFVAAHPGLSAVARREAVKGLARSALT